MKITKFNKTFNNSIELEYYEANNLLFYRKKIITNKEKIVEGIAELKDLKALKNTLLDIPIAKNWVVVSNKYLKLRRLTGSSAKGLNDEISFEKPFTDYKVPGKKLIHWNSYHEEIFDHDMKPLPTGIHFDYISGRMNNVYYDLKKLVDILKTNENIHFLPNESYRKDFLNPEKESAISLIPSYNAYDGQTESIKFFWSPSILDYRKVYEKALTYTNKEFPLSDDIRKAVFELNIIGLKGAYNFDLYDYYPEYKDEDEY